MRIFDLKRALAYSRSFAYHSSRFACFAFFLLASALLPSAHAALSSLFSSSPTFASSKNISRPIAVSATLGEPRLTLFGWTSPFSEVSLQGGTSLFSQTTANSAGFFIFEDLFILQSLGDYCLLSKDKNKRTTNPVCLPPLPQGAYIIKVGPVILPPTISLAKGKFLPGEFVQASGETTPNTEVEIALFRKPKKRFFIRRIYAFSLPEYKIKSDSQGHFTFNLPSYSADTYRVFANSSWQEKASPKSNTLTFQVLTIWQWILEKLKAILNFGLGLFKPPNLSVIIFVQTLAVLLLLKKRARSSKLARDQLRSTK